MHLNFFMISRDLTSEPALPRYRRKPQRYDDGSEAYKFEDAKSFHKQHRGLSNKELIVVFLCLK